MDVEPEKTMKGQEEDPSPGFPREIQPATSDQENLLLHSLLEYLPDRIYYKDLQSRLIFGSRSYARLFNMENFSAIYGKTDFDFFSKDHARVAFEDEQEIIRTGEAKLNMEEMETWPDGHVTWCSTSKAPLRDDQGRIIGTFGISQDTTAQKQAQETLIASEAFQNSLLNAIPIPVFYKDSEGIYKGFNKAFETFFGTSREFLEGKTLFDLRAPEHAELFCARDCILLETGGVQHYEARVENWRGELRDVIFDKAVYTDSKGKIKGLIGTVLDVTERMRADEALKHHEKELTTIFENAPFMMLLLDGEGNVRRGNALACSFAGLSGTEMVGMPVGEALGCTHSGAGTRGCDGALPCQQCLLHGMVWDSQENGQRHYQVEAGLCRRTLGKEQGLTLLISTSQISIGNEPMVLLSIQDITEHKKLEGQLRQSQKMEAIGTLAGGVAHDFNNILTAIIGFATLAKMKMQVDDPNVAAINQILSASERATHLTHSLLAFSRKQVISLKPVNLNDLVRRLEKLLRRLIGEDIELPTRLAPSGISVLADAGQIEQVLMNLVTNARDAMPGGGMIAIITEEAELDSYFVKAHGFGAPGKYALITVSDNGSGMDEKTRAQIFEPFFTTKELGRGTGLGLSIVYGIVKQHNGNILVYSEPGHGTTFKVYLPLTKSCPEPSTLFPSAPPHQGTEIILLAEDDNQVRTLTRTVLEDFGYRVIAAVDGQDAIDKFRLQAANIDLILLDVIMPKKTGLEAYEAIKAIRPGIRAVFTSGYSDGIIQNTHIINGGLNYVPKPVNPVDLLKKIREVLDEKRQTIP